MTDAELGNLIAKSICHKNEMSDYYVEPEEGDEGEVMTDGSCACDNCFYGRDKLAKLLEEQVLLRQIADKKLSVERFMKQEAQDAIAEIERVVEGWKA